MSQHDTHWLDRQTPVPGKPGGQPGTGQAIPVPTSGQRPSTTPTGSTGRLPSQANPVASPARRPGHPGTDIRPTSQRDNHQLNRQTPVPGKPGGQARKTGAAMVVVAVRH